MSQWDQNVVGKVCCDEEDGAAIQLAVAFCSFPRFHSHASKRKRTCKFEYSLSCVESLAVDLHDDEIVRSDVHLTSGIYVQEA
jgi:hypothetical protein